MKNKLKKKQQVNMKRMQYTNINDCQGKKILIYIKVQWKYEGKAVHVSYKTPH
jgi:hypothetical protein